MNIREEIHGFSYQRLLGLAFKKPLMLQLGVTRNCNQRCKFCFHGCETQNSFPEKNVEDWKELVGKLRKKFGIEEINFTGGEPFMYEGIFELLEHAKKTGIRKNQITTNGTISLRGKAFKNIDELGFSIHGLEESHDKIVGVPGAFQKVCRNIEYAVNRCPVAVKTVVIPENINFLEEIYNYFEKYDLVYHSFDLYLDKESLGQRKKIIEKELSIFHNFLKKIPGEKRNLKHGTQNILIDDKDFFEARIPLPHCAAGKYKMVVNYKGDVYPCQLFQEPDFYCGNVFRDDIEKIWEEGQGFNKFRRMISSENIPGKCEGCFKKEKCLGGCLAWRIFNQKTKKYERDIRCSAGSSYLGS